MIVLKASAQRIDAMPESYVRLRDTTMELAEELETVSHARKAFKTESVRGALDALIDLVVKAATEIANYYSQSRTGPYLFDFVHFESALTDSDLQSSLLKSSSTRKVIALEI